MGSLRGAYHTPLLSEAKRATLRGERSLFKIEVKQGAAHRETRNKLTEVGAL